VLFVALTGDLKISQPLDVRRLPRSFSGPSAIAFYCDLFGRFFFLRSLALLVARFTFFKLSSVYIRQTPPPPPPTSPPRSGHFLSDDLAPPTQKFFRSSPPSNSCPLDLTSSYPPITLFRSQCGEVVVSGLLRIALGASTPLLR